MVGNGLDLKPILGQYVEGRGYPPFDPRMMVALLLYSYTQGVYSSRRIARACEQRVDFMVLTGRQEPDFRTIALFRQRHLEALKGLFSQVVELCRQAGLVKLGHVALDGTRMRANASKNKSLTYGRMTKLEESLKEEIDGWFEKAQEIDNAEDQECGRDQSGDEVPDWMKDKQKRLEKIRQAKKELEEAAKAEVAAPRDPAKTGHKAKPTGTPKEKAQRNLTDGESRIMRTGTEGYIQAYNAQAAVDSEHQIIVAQHVTTAGNDSHEMMPLLNQIRESTGKQAKEISADAGYSSEHNLKQLRKRRIRGYVANRWKRNSMKGTVDKAPPKNTGPYVLAMWRRLKQGGVRSRYRLRKQVVEPVFGQIKHARGFRQFLLRGQQKVAGEWSLLCTAHNLLKLAAAS